MTLEIHHQTRYTYENDVFLNPQILNLVPQCRKYLHIKQQTILIDPEPKGINTLLGLENTQYYQIWFQTNTKYLNITTSLIAEIYKFNPLNFIYSSELQMSPEGFHLGSQADEFIRLYSKHQNNSILTSTALHFYKNSFDVISFLTGINEYVHQNWMHILRIEPGFQNPITTFQEKKGSCRDLACMLLEMVRSVGLAAKYVSGYAYNPELSEDHNLHAWIDIYLPGAGWIGIDPSLGLFCDHHYIPLSSSYKPEDTLPVIGSYAGNAASQLFTHVAIRNVSNLSDCNSII